MLVGVLEREIKRNKETAEVDAGDELWRKGEGEACRRAVLHLDPTLSLSSFIPRR